MMIKNLVAPRRLLAAAGLFSALLLTACGGGGGGGEPAFNNGVPPSQRFGASSTLANVCTAEGEKRFIRAYVDEVYLWYNEVPEVDASAYANVRDYFDALTNLPKDRFSVAIPSSQAGSLPARSSALSNHTNTVPVAKVITDSDGRRIGYIQFNDHEIGAQDDLITAFRKLRDEGAEHLVLDLRFNSGGYLYIARTAASLVAGPAAEGKVFEVLHYNDKRQAETAASTFVFSSTVQDAEVQYPDGTLLPQLNLPRLYVLTSGLTCSSSESLINGLRGIDIQVVLVGATTCGKPYGFHRKDNCGTAFFPIEFQGANAKGFSDYTNGFQPTCNVADDPRVAAGGADDPLLNAALFHIDNNACPAGTANSLAQSSAGPRLSPLPASRPAWAGRLLAPQR